MLGSDPITGVSLHQEGIDRPGGYVRDVVYVHGWATHSFGTNTVNEGSPQRRHS